MQSDPRIQLALEALSARTQAFRTAVTNAAEQLRAFLNAHSLGSDNLVDRLTVELGEFAVGRIDPRKFAPFADWGAPPVNPGSISAVEQAARVLSDLGARGDDLFVVDVPPGGSLWHAVATAIEQIGLAFSAAHTANVCRRISSGESRALASPAPLPFRSWGRAQRQLAPPLVVHVDGSDLRVSGLAEFLDGSQKLVLVVRGEAAPAPLVRLISPGTFVLQTTDGSGLDRLAAWGGPGIGALLPEGAACFVHDPPGGQSLSERLRVTYLPTEPPRKALGGISAAQQVEELRQLSDLAAVAEGANAATPAAAPDPVERLAAWLIRQAGVG